jgi:signal peptidase I
VGVVPDVRRERPSRHVAWRLLACVALVGMVALWVVCFRPQALGGPVAYVEVVTPQMARTIPEGDVVAAKKQATYRPGDVIVYHLGTGHSGPGTTVISRIVGGNGVTGFVTKGDDAVAAASFHPTSADVVGEVWFHFPRTVMWALTITIAIVFATLLVVAGPLVRRRRSTA